MIIITTDDTIGRYLHRTRDSAQDRGTMTGIIRDLTPTTIMIGKKGTVVVLNTRMTTTVVKRSGIGVDPRTAIRTTRLGDPSNIPVMSGMRAQAREASKNEGHLLNS